MRAERSDASLDPTSERAPLPRALARPARGRVLLLAPHADDDVLGAGGTCALHTEQGDPVHVLVTYDGVEGDPERRFRRGELRDLRRREARAGGAHLGLTDYEFLEYPEGHLPSPAELLAASRWLANRVRELEVDTVYSPWVGDHHLDHHVLARTARLGLALAGFRGVAWGYEVWTPLIPTIVVDTTAVHARKVAAIAEHASQIAYHDIVHKGLALSAHRAMYLAPGARHGEAFAPLGEPFGRDRELLGR
jgi:LmbE family N-acetylglucosaminyl deacetylase